MYEYKCKVLNVVDGDTVDVEIDLGFHIKKTDRIRMLGIDTAELNSKDPSQRELAVVAKNRVRDLAPAITRIKTEMDKGDKYGRLLGTLYMGDNTTSINEILVQEGLAVPYMV
jgi:micrococcal nuclease